MIPSALKPEEFESKPPCCDATSCQCSLNWCWPADLKWRILMTLGVVKNHHRIPHEKNGSKSSCINSGQIPVNQSTGVQSQSTLAFISLVSLILT